MIATLTAAVVALVSGLHGPALYALVGLLAFGEGAAFLGLVLPGETAVFLGAALVAQGHGRLALLVPVIAVAAVAGDSVGYEVGRWLGPRLRSGRLGRWIGVARWRRAEAEIERRGAAAVVLGRWVGVLRALVPAVAGATRMPYRRFLTANVAGGVSWAVAVSLLGYGAGAAWPQVQAWLGRGGLVLVAAVVVILLSRRVLGRGGGRPGGHDRHETAPEAAVPERRATSAAPARAAL
ncbi:DedA family protein [Georgenia ruanii]|uniref:DedA family protein n=1 Tax=Georgenia ruanii TaxID=348442 RepID=A0A7J9V1G2_9MICO|nr:DedA family protein [Georgenia ruanii]MPV89804.1 DedA family protein [Georgenia ruanii]